MEVYTSTLTLQTDSLTDSLSCPHNALLSHMKLIPGFHALLKMLSAERFVYSSGHPPLCMLSELLGMLNIIFGEKDRRSVSHCKRFVFKNQNALYTRSFSFSLFYLTFMANWSPYHSHWFPLINRSFDHNSKTFFLNHN